MGIKAIFDKIGEINRYFRMRKQKRLYKQWMQKAELPPDEVPNIEQEEILRTLRPEKTSRKQSVSPILYILLGLILAVFCGLFILLAIQSF